MMVDVLAKKKKSWDFSLSWGSRVEVIFAQKNRFDVRTMVGGLIETQTRTHTTTLTHKPSLPACLGSRAWLGGCSAKGPLPASCLALVVEDLVQSLARPRQWTLSHLEDERVRARLLGQRLCARDK